MPPPKTSWNISDHIRFKNRAKQGIPIDEEKLHQLRKNHKISVPNPLSTLRIFTDFESALLLLAQGMQLACFYAISTGASSAFSSLYGFNDLQISLMFVSLSCTRAALPIALHPYITVADETHCSSLSAPAP